MRVTGLVFGRMYPQMVKFVRWYGVVCSLITDLGVGTVTASALRLAGLGGSLICWELAYITLAALWNSLQKPVHLNREY